MNNQNLPNAVEVDVEEINVNYANWAATSEFFVLINGQTIICSVDLSLGR